ncbi:SixA phosphatase family protein [Solimonas marina]|uniref:Histidine phosphatase family protein n=1 Tax=Solimonas marina TaxID=2714601 RepID=A0A969W9W7_9GAMM|nr:histidine phosphatase family protein [Solimonas marina]NKF22589.1 histidine phosphatase family protein [Solimonas marina]
MRLLTIVRHAKSSWDHPDLSDFERPLNERGQRDAPLMAAWARNATGVPDRIVSSPAVRALTTAQAFADRLGIEHEQIAIQPRIYEATLAALLRLIRDFDDRSPHVMLFGHNPGLSELAASLADCPFADLPTCAVVHLELPGKRWETACDGRGELLSYEFPKRLRD